MVKLRFVSVSMTFDRDKQVAHKKIAQLTTTVLEVRLRSNWGLVLLFCFLSHVRVG